MNREQTLDWLSTLQAEIGTMLRTPLEAQDGVLRAMPRHYAAGLLARVGSRSTLDAAARLAVYNRQYWFRLLRVLQNDLPLCSALLGPWFFNQVAMRFLQSHPPRGYDLGQVTDGFDAFMQHELDGVLQTLGANALRVPSQALIEACRIDLAFRKVFLAPEQPNFRAQRRDQDTLTSTRLRFSAAFARVQQHWPLVALRAEVLGRSDERAVSLPAGLPQAQSLALTRTPRGVVQRLLEPREARLLTLLETLALDAALAQLEAECPPHARAGLPKRIRAWLARAVALGFFRAADD